jgi:predicted NAD/FAD-binding protein
MSFGVSAPSDDLEWGAENVGALFGQRRNIFRPAFWRFLRDIFLFNLRARQAVRHAPHLTMAELIAQLGLGDWFSRFYILPMGGAIWSCSLDAILSFPAKTFVDFFDAHGLLTVTQQPQWYTVTGGSAEYVNRLVAPFRYRIRTGCGARRIARADGKVQVTDTDGATRHFDKIVMACHADEALALLSDATADERRLLGAFRYQKNTVVLHRHAGIMPRRRACWSSWIYHADTVLADAPISVTYWMNHLQGIDPACPVFVTLNPRSPIPAEAVFTTEEFTHPVYDGAVVAAQAGLAELQGQNNTWFGGAYHRDGFHEDGLASAVDIARTMGIEVPWR